MFKILLSYFILLSFPIYTQWKWINPYPHGADFNSIFFISSTTGWIGASNGTILKTTDGGINWIEKGVITYFNIINDISFIDENYGVAVGVDNNGDGDRISFIMNSTDGGESWKHKYIYNGHDESSINGIIFQSPGLGYAVGSNAIYISTDKGVTWNKQLEHPFDLSDVFALNQNLVVAVGRGGAIMRSSNSGLNWQIVSSGITKDLNKLYFVDSLRGFAVGSSGAIIKTTNAGLSWFQVPSGTTEILKGIHFASSSNGIIVGNNGIVLRTTDGGASWDIQNIVPGRYLTSVYMYDLNNAIAVGSYGFKATTTDGGISWISDYRPLLNPGDFRSGMYLDANTILFTGDNGVYKSTDDGNTWKQSIIESGSSINVMNFSDSRNGLGLGNALINGVRKKLIARTTDGGSTWDVKFSDSVNFIQISYIKKSSIAFLITEKENIYSLYKTTNGGLSWNLVDENTSFIGRIHFFNDSTGIGVDGSSVFKTTDGGITWIDLNAPLLGGGGYVSFSDEGYGIIATHEAAWMITTDFGNTWKVQSNWNISGNHVNSVSMAGKGVVTIVRGCANPGPAGGMIQYSTDAGTTWSYYGSRYPFLGVNFLNENLGIVVGKNGTIVAYKKQEVISVELYTFTASVNNDDVHLNWSTSTETNNYGFDVQRKLNDDFISLDFIKGNGSTIGIKNYSYVDKDILQGKYSYRLKQIDLNGSFSYSKEIEIDFNSLLDFSLEQNYPNPFNPTTKISYTIAKEGRASLIIYDVLGREVMKLFDEEKSKGNYSVEVDASELSSGIYFYRLQTEGFTETKKMVLLK